MKKILPYLITLFVFAFAGYTGYFFSLIPAAPSASVKRMASISKKTITLTPTQSTSIINKNVLGVTTYQTLPTPTIILKTTSNKFNPTQSDNNLKVEQTSNANTPSATPTQQILIPTSTPIKSEKIQIIYEPTSTPQPTSTPMPTVVVKIVNLQIQTPDGTSNFTVTLKDGANVCDILQTAKDVGKITSLTLDDSYLSAYKSKYVLEMNGYRNNWTFTVNGASPLGCSLSNPKPNDIIVWKFL